MLLFLKGGVEVGWGWGVEKASGQASENLTSLESVGE